MILRTYTRAWTLRSRLLAIDDVHIPVAGGLTYLQIYVFLGSAAFWGLLNALFGFTAVVPNPGVKFILLVAPPIGATWLADRPVKYDKSVEEIVASKLRRAFEPTQLNRMAASNGRIRLTVYASVWKPHPSRMPYVTIPSHHQGN